ncbi:MAG: MurR/RpiR family transcriptional regulator [Clostridia bacterium]|nr:MurR/RpiR family transcriptional regulator [Clostridia bacterium]
MDQLSQRQPALLMKMRDMRENLSRAERQLVDYILENPQKVITLSVAGLADASGVSDATVVRACRKLGMSGYQDLKVTLAQDIVTPLQSIHEEITADDDARAITAKVFNSTLNALQYTHETLRPETIEDAAEALMAAKRVAIIALGNSHAIAIDLQHKLMRLGILATCYTDSHLMTIAAAGMGEGDVVFAISHSGSSRDVVDAAKLASMRGAKVISLTNIGRSPLSKIADICLYTASKETLYRIVSLSSRIVQMAIIDAIYTIIAIRSEDSVEGFRRIEHALDKKKY